MTVTLSRSLTPPKAQRLKSRGLTARMPPEPVCGISVDQYHEMIRAGILRSGDPIELLEGWLVLKMMKNPAHMVGCELLADALRALLPKGWFLKFEAPLSLSDSEPEPDLMVVCGVPRDYGENHPTAKHVGLVIEVADTSRTRDMGLKKRLYARANVVEYWVINLLDGLIEVFTDPTGPTKKPDYQTHQVYSTKQKVPVILKGKKIGSILVSDVLP